MLRDGAAALYGSDAIAGVINIILKKASSGGEVTLGNGQYDEGDGKRSNFGVHGGISLADQGWLHLSAAYRDQAYTNRAGADLSKPGDVRYGQVNRKRPAPTILTAALPVGRSSQSAGRARAAAQFQGSSSARRLTGVSATRASTWRR